MFLKCTDVYVDSQASDMWLRTKYNNFLMAAFNWIMVHESSLWHSGKHTKKKKNPQECMTAEHPWISNQEDVWKNLSLVNQIAWGNEIMQKCG